MLQIQSIFLIITALVYYIFYALYYQFFLYGLIAFFVFYWISSIFVFLFKSGLYSKTTSVIQRFWKRTLYLFWSLELFLFFIYSWLILISPSEVEWMFDNSQLYLSSYVRGPSFFLQILLTLTVLYITSLSQYFLFYSKIEFYLLALLILLFSVLLNDGSQVIITSLYYGNVSVWFSPSNFTWSIAGDLIENRANHNYTWLVIILKFWHTAFIVVFYLFVLMFFLQINMSFHGMYSSILQNFIFLYLFSFIMYYFLLKDYMNIIYEYVYSWFFVNKFVS